MQVDRLQISRAVSCYLKLPLFLNSINLLNSDISFLHLYRNICIFSSSHFQNRLVWLIWGDSWVIFTLHHCMLPSHHHNTDFNLSVHITHGRRSETKQRCKKQKKTETDRDEDWNGEKRYLQTPCGPQPGFSILSLCCCSGNFINPKCDYMTSWEWHPIQLPQTVVLS